MTNLEKNTRIINDIYNKMDLKIIAEKYNMKLRSVILKKGYIDYLKYPIKIINNKIVCYKCNNNEKLVIHHNHKTDESIAIVCQSCNLKLGNNEIEYKLEEHKELIIDLFYKNHSITFLKNALQSGGIKTSITFLNSRLKEWGLSYN